jgi:hypothetical protein
MIPGRSTFIEKIIKKGESQDLVGPKKRPTRIPQAVVSPTMAHVEIHRKSEGIEQSFKNTDLPPLNPLEEGSSNNMKEGIGETSGVAKAYPPPPPNRESPAKEGGISKIPDKESAVKILRRPNNQQFQIEYPDQEPPKNFRHIFEQMAQANQQQPRPPHWSIQ